MTKGVLPKFSIENIPAFPNMLIEFWSKGEPLSVLVWKAEPRALGKQHFVHLSLRVELQETNWTVCVLYTVTSKMCCYSDLDSKMCCYSDLDQGQDADHKIIGQARCWSHDDMTLSSAVVTEKAWPLILSYVILAIKCTQGKVFALMQVMAVLL